MKTVADLHNSVNYGSSLRRIVVEKQSTLFYPLHDEHGDLLLSDILIGSVYHAVFQGWFITFPRFNSAFSYTHAREQAIGPVGIQITPKGGGDLNDYGIVIGSPVWFWSEADAIVFNMYLDAVWR